MARTEGVRMRGRTVIALVVATVAVGMCVVPAGARVPSSARAAAAAKRMLSARTTSAFQLSSPPYATVETVTLTAGAWTVIAKAAAINFSTPDVVHCRLLDATHHLSLDTASAEVGNGTSAGQPLTNLAILTVPTAGKVRVQQQCGHDSTNGDSAYLDADATLVAFQTLDGTAAGQTLARTNSATSLPSDSPATVLSLTLAAGTYAIGVKTTVTVPPGNPQAVRCGESATDVDMSLHLGDGSAHTGTTTFFRDFTGPGTVNLECQDLTSGTALLQPDTVLWARKVKAETTVADGCGATLGGARSDLISFTRTNGVCWIYGGQPNLMAATQTTKGAWVAIGDESWLFNDSTTQADFVRCELFNGGTGTVLDATALWEPINSPPAGGMSVLGTFHPTGPDEIRDVCIRDTADKSHSNVGSLILIRI